MKTLIYTHPGGVPKTESLQKVFRQCGMHVETCDSESRLHYLSMTESYTAIVVQASLTFEELTALFKEWQKTNSKALFIVLTPLQSGLLRGQALASGIHRYYIEPYSYTSLVKEILLYEYSHNHQDPVIHVTSYFEVDILKRTISFMGIVLELTKTEFDILSFLLRKRGTALSRVQIWEEVWGYEEYPLANTIDVHINRLRKKLPEKAQRFINTVYGVGYRIMADA